MASMGIRSQGFTRIVELTPDLRQQIEDTIEQLLSILDTWDGDADEEPILGWNGQPGSGPLSWDSGHDREVDVGDEREAYDADFEPDFSNLTGCLPSMPFPNF
ncbi:MAG: hypothetical protein ACK4ZU_14960 [Allorhizobium sp.]